MDEYFKLPTGYACIQRNGDQLYAYNSTYNVRDTYELDNFKYLKVGTATNNYGYTVSVCLPSTETHLIPSSMAGEVFLAVSIFIALIVTGLFHVFRR